MPSLNYEFLTAVKEGNVEGASLILSQGLPNAATRHLAMSDAIKDRSPSMVALLLRFGIAPTQESFFRALECVEIVEMLIPFVSLTNVVHDAISSWASVQVVRMLLEAGAPAKGNAVTRACMTSVPYIDLLLAYGASPFVDIPLYACDKATRVIQKAQLRILEDINCNGIACFIACYRPLRYTEEEGVIDERFIHPLAHLTWAHGVRPIRRRLVEYLVDRRSTRALLVRLRALALLA
jgi:hypothetical protein